VGDAETEQLFYLGVDEVLGLHAEVLGCSEDGAAARLRSRAGLESALSRPLWYAHYANADLALQAAVLAHGLAEGQCFLDGNKRTALAGLLTFLLTNGYTVEASQVERAAWILRLSQEGKLEELADVIRSAIRPC
jgi:death-on-curing protein